MKRILTGMLAAVLALTLAGCGESPSPTDTATTTTSGSTTTTMSDDKTATTTLVSGDEAKTNELKLDNGLYESDALAAINAFFEGLKSSDTDALRRQLWDDTAAEDLARAVKLTDYTLTPQEMNGSGEYFRYYAHLTVAESTLDRIPTGESEWVVWYGYKRDGIGMYLCPVGEDIRDQHRLESNTIWTPDYFCYYFSTYFRVFETLDVNALSAQSMLDWDEELMNMRYRSLQKTTNRPNRDYNDATPQELAAYAKITFGVGGVDFTKSDLYKEELEMLHLDGKGGRWMYAVPVSYTSTDNRITVELRYHADALYLLEAVTMRYEVERVGLDYRLLSCEKVSGTNYPPLFGAI